MKDDVSPFAQIPVRPGEGRKCTVQPWEERFTNYGPRTGTVVKVVKLCDTGFVKDGPYVPVIGYFVQFDGEDSHYPDWISSDFVEVTK